MRKKIKSFFDCPKQHYFKKKDEAEAKNKLMSLKEKGEIILRTGNHGQVFMSLKGGQLKSYDDYTEAFHNWVVAKSRNSQ